MRRDAHYPVASAPGFLWERRRAQVVAAPDEPFHVPGAAIAVAEPAATIAAAMARDATRCARLREIAIAAGDGRDADVAVQVEDICMLLWQFLE